MPLPAKIGLTPILVLPMRSSTSAGFGVSPRGTGRWCRGGTPAHPGGPSTSSGTARASRPAGGAARRGPGRRASDGRSWHLDQTRVAQHPQVLGHRRLAHPQDADQVDTDGSLGVPEQIEDPPPVRLGQHLEHHRHAPSMPLQLYACQVIKSPIAGPGRGRRVRGRRAVRQPGVGGALGPGPPCRAAARVHGAEGRQPPAWRRCRAKPAATRRPATAPAPAATGRAIRVALPPRPGVVHRPAAGPGLRAQAQVGVDRVRVADERQHRHVVHRVAVRRAPGRSRPSRRPAPGSRRPWPRRAAARRRAARCTRRPGLRDGAEGAGEAETAGKDAGQLHRRGRDQPTRWPAPRWRWVSSLVPSQIRSAMVSS